MNLRRMVQSTVLGLFITGVVGTSSALALTIDFTDGTWAGAGGTTSFTTHSSGVNLASSNGTITVNTGAGNLNDGLGVNGFFGEDGEVNGIALVEQLTISFDSPVTLNTVSLTNLFRETVLFIPTIEAGQYSINGGSFITFQAAPGQVPGSTNGLLTLTINQSGVNDIRFRAAVSVTSDYSIKGLTVPEPMSLLLLGSGLAGLGLVRRKFGRG